MSGMSGGKGVRHAVEGRNAGPSSPLLYARRQIPAGAALQQAIARISPHPSDSHASDQKASWPLRLRSRLDRVGMPTRFRASCSRRLIVDAETLSATAISR